MKPGGVDNLVAASHYSGPFVQQENKMEQGILKVTEREVGEIEASAVKIGITVEGENLLYGNAALEKCAEVKRTVERLKIVDPEVLVHVKSVLIKSESGWFSKSSKGVYCLELTLKHLDKMNELLGVILDIPNVTMNSLEWVFEEDLVKIALIKKAMAKAKLKAEAMSSAVAHHVVGIRACSDSYDIPNVNATVRSPLSNSSAGRMLRARGATSVPTADIGTEMKGKKEIVAVASVEFIIAKEKAEQCAAEVRPAAAADRP
jgi:hypothetical protein